MGLIYGCRLHHNGEDFTEGVWSSMIVRNRLTVSLAPGQREALERIASINNAKLAHVIRYALMEFLEHHADPQLQLRFPKGTNEDQ